MNPAADLFTKPQAAPVHRVYTQSEHDEFIGYQYRSVKRKLIDKETGEFIGYKSVLNHAASMHLEQMQAEHEAQIFVPDEKTEGILSDIEISLKDWGDAFSRRREAEKKTADYLRKVVEPSGLMGSAGMLADKLENCRNSGVLGVDIDHGKKIIKWTSKCSQVKLCPDESRAEQKRLANRYQPAVEAWLDERPGRRKFRYAVFEPVNIKFGDLESRGQRYKYIPDDSLNPDGSKKYKSGYRRENNPGYVQGGIDRAYLDLRNMLRHKSMEAVKGAFTAMECPQGSTGTDWNVHINCLLLTEGHFDYKTIRDDYGNRIHFYSEDQMVQKTQRHLLRRAEKSGQPIPELSRRQVLMAAFREIIKYSAKQVPTQQAGEKTDAPAITEWAAEQFVEWWGAHKGFRRCRSYGVLNGIGKPELVPLNVQWVGSMNWCRDFRRYEIEISKRGSINSLKGVKSTTEKSNFNQISHDQADFFNRPSPPG